MPSHTVLDLSRWQFAFTATFQMTFPAVEGDFAAQLQGIEHGAGVRRSL